jgi:hypothetical protein
MRTKTFWTLFTALIFFASSGVFAQTAPPPALDSEAKEAARINYFSAAVGIETSGLSPEGFSLNAVYLGDFRIASNFSFGVKGGFYFASDNVFSVETMFFGRWYFFPEKVRVQANGKWYQILLDLFVQAGVGTDAVFRDNTPSLSRALPVFDVSAGTRIPLPWNLYAEPFIRGGYPSVFGIGIMAGYRFPSFGKIERKTKDEGTR